METKGRFAPSPSGRMHLGNIFSALMSWLSAKSKGGKWVLRIEDLDPQRSRLEYARLIEDDLHWLGLEWDEGGIDGKGESAPYCQSLRSDIYNKVFSQLSDMGLTYECRCTRGEILSTQAPHESDGRIVYSGTCRPPRLGGLPIPSDRLGMPIRATRLYVSKNTINFTDRTYGFQSVNLAEHCGDFVIKRADGAWSYQLAVVADDADMGITEVVRGSDLLLSSAQQIYLYNLLGINPPEFAHVPILCNSSGIRLSKRDSSLSMEQLRKDFSPGRLLGLLASLAGLIPYAESVNPKDLIEIFHWDNILSREKILTLS